MSTTPLTLTASYATYAGTQRLPSDYALIAGILGNYLSDNPAVAEDLETAIIRLAYALADATSVIFDINEFANIVERAAGYEFI
jgi:hypothetical protein